MTDYRSLYFSLAVELADTIERLDKISEALKAVQRRAEEEFIGIEESENKDA